MFKGKSLILSGPRAIDAHNRLQARGGGAAAFDAAGGSGQAWLQSQLELINPNPVEPLQAVTHARDMPIKRGGGWPDYLSAYATNYSSTGGGVFGLQGTNNTEIPEAQIDVQKGIWPTFLWASGFTMTYVDMKKQEQALSNGLPAPLSFQTLFNKSVETIWNKAIDYVTYLGFLGQVGLVNNPNVPSGVALTGGSGTTWATKTPAQILVDVNYGINQTVFNSGYDMVNGAATALLIPYQQWQQLTLPMTIGGVASNMSTIEYIKKNCVAASYGINFEINPLPNPWISGQGLGGTDRGVFYRKNIDDIMLQIPQPKEKGMTVPTTDKGGAYQTLFVGCIGCVQFLRTTTCFYLDGI